MNPLNKRPNEYTLPQSPQKKQKLEEAIATIDILPSEVLFNIFHHLNYLELKNLRLNKKLNETLIAFISSDFIKKQSNKIKSLFNKIIGIRLTISDSQKIRILNTLFSPYLTPKLVNILADLTPDSHELDLSHSDLNDNQLRIISKQFQDIRQLNLNKNAKLTLKEVEKTIAKFPNLEELSVYLPALNPFNLVQLNLPKLTFLEVYNTAAIWIVKLNARSIEDIEGSLIIEDKDRVQDDAWIQNCKNSQTYPVHNLLNLCDRLKKARSSMMLQYTQLRRLELINNYSSKSEPYPWDEIEQALNTLKNIEEVDIDSAPIDDNQLLMIAQKLPKLEKLHLWVGKCNRLTSAGIIEAFKWLPQLKELNFSRAEGLEDEMIDFEIDFWNNDGEHDTDSEPDLEDLEGCEPIEGGFDEEFEFITTHCLNLECLNVESLFLLDENGYRSISNLTKLSNLTLSDTLITDSTLDSISQKCQKITQLDISKCKRLTSQGMVAALRNFTELETLEISDTNIEVADLLNIVKHLQKLRVVEITNTQKKEDPNSYQQIALITQLRTLCEAISEGCQHKLFTNLEYVSV